MTLDEILSLYGKEHNIVGLSLNKDGVCQLLLNDNMIVTFEKALDGTGFYQYTSVGTVPVSLEKEVSLKALEGNLFGSETGRATLAYVPNTRTLMLFEFIPDTITYEQFKDRLPLFLGYTAHWTNKLKTTKETPYDASSINRHISKLRSYDNLEIFFP